MSDNEEFDYRELLIKYMAHVTSLEGVSFLSYDSYGKFSKDELKRLESVRIESKALANRSNV